MTIQKTIIKIRLKCKIIFILLGKSFDKIANKKENPLKIIYMKTRLFFKTTYYGISGRSGEVLRTCTTSGKKATQWRPPAVRS